MTRTYVAKIETWQDIREEAKLGTSKEFSTADKARNALNKALAATDILNELGITKINAAGWIEEVNA
jgi:hypothetical protein